MKTLYIEGKTIQIMEIYPPIITHYVALQFVRTNTKKKQTTGFRFRFLFFPNQTLHTPHNLNSLQHSNHFLGLILILINFILYSQSHNTKFFYLSVQIIIIKIWFDLIWFSSIKINLFIFFNLARINPGMGISDFVSFSL